MIHSENCLEYMKKYHGSIVFTNRGNISTQTKEPLVGWIITQTPQAMDGT